MSDAEEPLKLGNRYEVREVIRGREHIVYHAVDAGRFQREVALVAPNAAVSGNPEWLQRFVEDSRKLGELQSPYLTTVHDFVEEGRWDSNCYLIREWSDTTLEAVIADSIQPHATAGILKQLLLGVQALHRAGIAHGVLSPSGVFLSADFESVRIGDLGLDAPIGGDPYISDLRLSLEYMAPELFESDVPVAPAVDIYSVGHMAYRLLLGRERFEAEFAAIYNSQAEEVRNERWSAWHRDPGAEARPLHEIDAEIPQALSELVARMMAKDPALRHADAAAALGELDGAQQQLGQASTMPRPGLVDSGAEVQLDLSGGGGRDSAMLRFLKSWQGIVATVGGVLLLLLILVISGGDEGGVTLDQVKLTVKAMLAAEQAAIEAGADQPPPLPAWTEAGAVRDQARAHKEKKDWAATHQALLDATGHYQQAQTDAEARSTARERIPSARQAMEQAEQQALEQGADGQTPAIAEFANAQALADGALTVAARVDELSMSEVDAVVADFEQAAELFARAAELALKQRRQQDEARIAAEVTARLDAVVALRQSLIEQGIEQHPGIDSFAMGERFLQQARATVGSADLADDGERGLVGSLIGNAESAYQLAVKQLTATQARAAYAAALETAAAARQRALDAGAAGNDQVPAWGAAEDLWQQATRLNPAKADPAAADPGSLQQAGVQLEQAQAGFEQALDQLARLWEIELLDAAIEQTRALRALAIEQGADRHPAVDAYADAETLWQEALARSESAPEGDALEQLVGLTEAAARGFEQALAQRADAAALEQMRAAQQQAGEARRAAVAAGADRHPAATAFADGDVLREQATWQVATARERKEFDQVRALLDDAATAYRHALAQMTEADASAAAEAKALAAAEAEAAARRQQWVEQLTQARAEADQARAAAVEAGADSQPAFSEGEAQLEQATEQEPQALERADITAVMALLGQAVEAFELAAEQQREHEEELQGAQQAVFGGRSMEFVALAKGCFQMGSEDTARGAEHARPDRDEAYHQACLPADIAIARHEVTQGQYRVFARATGREQTLDERCSADDCPAVFIGWRDANAYAQWLSEQLGQRHRLPTEAEWAYAVREAGANPGLRFWGDDPGAACAYANALDRSSASGGGSGTARRAIHDCSDGFPSTAPVGSLKANALGLYDLFGNVWEWTCSAYRRDYDGSELRCADDAAASKLSIRGGSWQSEPRRIRAADRFWGSPEDRFQDLGFRLVRE